MKKITMALSVVALGMLFARCKKDSDNKSYSLTTYSTNDSAASYLYVNEQQKGKLPYVPEGVTDCGDSKALNLSLDPGTYALSVKSETGVLKNALVLVVGEDADVTTGSNYTLVQVDKCIQLEIDTNN